MNFFSSSSPWTNESSRTGQSATPVIRAKKKKATKANPSHKQNLLRIDTFGAQINLSAAHLSDVEILSLILSPLLRKLDCQPIARALIERFTTFGRAINASALDLGKIEGLDVNDIAAFKAAAAIAPLLLRKRVGEATPIRMWDELMDYLNVRIQDERVEVVRIIFLNSCSRLIADEEMQRGSITYAAIDPRDVIRRALELDAVYIVIVHNHPSGLMCPSPQDISLTKKIEQAAEYMNIAVLDHVIIGKGEYLSLRAGKFI